MWTAPNLDNCSQTELVAFAARPIGELEHELRRAAVPDQHTDQVAHLLRRYAGLALCARSARLSGHIVTALERECEMDATYNRLPAWARWP